MPRRSKRLASQIPSDSASEDSVGVVAQAKTEAVVPGGESRRESEANAPDRDIRSPLTLHKNPDSRACLNGMPLDILYEIFQRLPPPDLLHLSWSSKDLRGFLTNRKLSVSIWKKARSLVEGLPDCPGDLSEPQYAALAFGRHCQICLQRYELLHYLWSARVKACSKCLKTEFKTQVWKNCPKKLLGLVPFVTTPGGRTKRYHVKTLSLLSAQHKKAQNKAELVQEKINELRAKEEHGHKCELWFEAWMKNLKSQRKATVIGRLKALGWEKELAILGDSPEAPQNFAVVASIYGNNKTDQEFVKELSTLQRTLVDYLTGLRNRRLKAERKSFLQRRLKVLIQVIESCSKEIFPGNAITPNVADIFLTPLVQNIINDKTRKDFTADDLAPLRRQLSDLARQWQSEKEKELVAIIASACGESYRFDPATVLHLATTTFSCADCDRAENYISLRYPRILIHDHTTRKKVYLPTQMTFDLEILHGVCERTPWNQNGGVGFSMRVMEALSKLVKVCGLDPQTATVEEMNAIDPMFECIECNSPFDGRGVMRWQMVPYHQLGYHEGRSAEMEILNEEEARIARARLDEVNARERASRFGRNHNSKDYMVCTHCNERENSVYLQRHLFQAHDIEDPTDADMVPWLDGDQSIDRIYLWPPRKDKKWLKDPNMERGFGIPSTVC